MRRKPVGMAPVTIKIDLDVADYLNQLPNKSEFIRNAIAAQLGVPCPLCKGKGLVPRGVYEHYAPVIQENPPG